MPTAAALKMGVGFPLPVGKGTEGVREGRVLSSQAQDQNHKGELTLRHQCGICRRSTNQHLLAKCDTCHLHYHLSCLSPPLSRMPKKTKLMGWYVYYVYINNDVFCLLIIYYINAIYISSNVGNVLNVTKNLLGQKLNVLIPQPHVN